LKYGANGKRVEVTLRKDGPDAVLSVRDFGPGIPPEHLPRLTERFYRVDAAHSREQGGTGLGLAIVKHIAARHRARLGVESEVGKGAVFTVRFPLSTGYPYPPASSRHFQQFQELTLSCTCHGRVIEAKCPVPRSPASGHGKAAGLPPGRSVHRKE